MEQVKIDRESLYEEVWSDPVSMVAPRYGLSDVGVAKICRKLAIPLPQRGHWAMVKAGRLMKRAPLPKIKAGHAAYVLLNRLSPEMAQAKLDARQRAVADRFAVGNIVVPAELADPHRLTVAASKRLKRRQEWDDHKGLRSAPDEVLNILVTKGAIDRALRLLDTLIKKLESMGVVASIDAKAKTTWLDVRGIQVSISVSEHVARFRHEPTPAEIRASDRYWARWRCDPLNAPPYPRIPDFDYTPSGMLTISAGSWPGRNWRDTPRTSLEDRLGEVLDGLFALAEEIRIKQEEDCRREEARRRAVERRQFLEERFEKERARFKRLEKDARNFARANRLRAYVDAVEKSAQASPDGPAAEVLNWLAWARAKADWLDPLILVSDPILDAPDPK